MLAFAQPHPPSLGRNVVLLLDGTGNQFSGKNSNLIKLMSVLKVDETQLLYYSSGLGTVLPDGTSTWSQLKQKAAEVIDLALAWNFDAFVCDAYKFLMDFYRAGDKIYLFGFSRGAYVARALAGMIQRVGLLHAGNYNQIPLAYEVYTGPQHVVNENGRETSPAVLYRRIFGRSRLISIEFLGVWDTVSSLGGLDLPQLPFASGAKSVRIFRQALALDERRARFQPEYWHPDPGEIKLNKKIAQAQIIIDQDPESEEGRLAKQTLPILKEQLANEFPDKDVATGQEKNVECWFMGCHSDVGGGNDVNDYPSLSNIPLRWMLREAVRTGLVLDPCGVSLSVALTLPTTYTGHLDPEIVTNLSNLATMLRDQENDSKLELAHHYEVQSAASLLPQEALARLVEALARYDADAPSNLIPDELRPVKQSLTWKWWPLEVLWLQTRDYTNLGVNKKNVFKQNLGGSRQMVPGQKVHTSVKNRLKYDEETGGGTRDRYKGPAAKVFGGMATWDEVRAGQDENVIWEE